MKRNKKIYIGIGCLILLVITIMYFKGNVEKVKTTLVNKGTISQTIEDTGFVQPKNSYDLYANDYAKVTKVLVEVGEKVSKGQVLTELENLDIDIQINEMKTRISQAKAIVDTTQISIERTQLEVKDAQENFNRVQELFKAGAVTKSEYDKTQLLLDTWEKNLNEQNLLFINAKSQIQQLNQSLEALMLKKQQLVIKSPINGIVLKTMVKKEQVVLPKELLFSVAASEQLELKADILSDDLADIEIGQKVTISAPVLGSANLVGTVEKIYPSAEEKLSALGVIQRRVSIIVSLQEYGNLKPGYEVRVAIEILRKENILIVPREAVRTLSNGEKVVMIVKDNQVYYRNVETGIYDRYNIEIINGLDEGDIIVKDSSLEIKEKTRVEDIEK